MLNQELELLLFVKDHQPCAWVDVLNGVSCGSKTELDSILRRCMDTHRLVKTTSIDRPPLCTIQLTLDGEHALLSELEELRKDAAKQTQIKHQQCHIKTNTVVAVLSLLATIAGVAVALFAK